jgi:hypothetical protein
LLVFGSVVGVGGIALGFAALAGSSPGQATLEVTDVIASVTPDTVAPLIADAPTTTALSTDPQPTAPPTTTIPLSPLAELLGPAGSALPPVIEPRLRPTTLTIGDLELSGGPIRSVGLRTDGALEVPEADEIGWYRYGAAPGYEGATVLAAHVTWNGELGPFLKLGDLEPGARVEVALEDGTERIYEVTERTMYDKDQLPRERIWRNTGDETLVLITCGGSFNPEISRYRQNIVVYAVPIA